MKTSRFFSAAISATAGLLAVLFLVAGRPAAGQNAERRLVPTATRELAVALAAQMNAVQETFTTNRRALRTVRSPNGLPAYPRQEVANLVSRTGQDLDRAIANIQPGDLEPLRAWSADAIQRIQGELAASETVPVEASNRLLDQVGNVISRIFFLASHDDLEVKIWVGSTPPRAAFSFWPQGHVRTPASAPTVVRTNGSKDHILRGLYAYQASYTEGTVTKVIQYPLPAGAPAPQRPSERLDLVNGSSFFCCSFDAQSCRPVASEGDCHP